MNHTSGTFISAGGAELFYQVWQPNRDPKAALLICHGVGEHAGRYMNLVHPLTEQGFSVCGYDHVGCGRSQGQRGHIDSWDDFRDGLRSFLGWVESNLPELPIFLYGHSMGALVALDFIQRTPQGLQGVILSGAPFEPAGVATPAKVWLAKTLSRVWPTMPINLGIDPAALSRDPQVVQAYKKDPLVQAKVSVRWGAESLLVHSSTAARPDLVRLPVLFIHGTHDPLNLASGVVRFFEQIDFPDKQLLLYEGSLHEPHNDHEHERLAQDLINWLSERLAAPQPFHPDGPAKAL